MNIKRRPLSTIDNYIIDEIQTENGEVKEVVVGKSLNLMTDEYVERWQWPKVAKGQFFYLNKEKEPTFYHGTDEVLAKICTEENIKLDFKTKTGCPTKKEFVSALKLNVDTFHDISEYPKYPHDPEIYYINELKPQQNGKLDKLLSFFKPDTENDLLLIKSMFCTAFWNSQGSVKPMFAIMSKDDDKLGGRGVGKTYLTQILGDLSGQIYDYRQGDRIKDFQQGILTVPKANIVRIDNVKTNNLSSADIESLVTSKTISQRLPYEAATTTIPNNYLWCLTINDPSFSRDIAQRCVIIRLDRPKWSAQWVEDIETFMKAYKEEIIADILYILHSDPKIEFTKQTRFPDWQRRVLSKLTCSNDVINYISANQSAYDVTESHIDVINDVIESHIHRLKIDRIHGKYSDYDPSKHELFIPNSVFLEMWRSTENPRINSVGLGKFISRSRHKGLTQEKRNGVRGITVARDFNTDNPKPLELNPYILNHYHRYDTLIIK